MDDLYLYNYIKQAIKERKNLFKNTESDNFAQNYCRRELMKKKINFNPSNHQSVSIKKMKTLMKDFHHVETYIDLNELLYEITSINAKHKFEGKFNQTHSNRRNSKVLRPNKFSSESQKLLSTVNMEKENEKISDPIQALKKRFKGEINQMMNRKYQNENTQMNSLINHLQKETNFANSLLRNNSTDYLSYLDNSLQKIVRQDDPTGLNSQQNQKIFQYLNQTLSRSLDTKTPKSYFRSTKLNSKQQKQETQLLHKISTYLQIALEHQHKQKWASKQLKKFRATHGGTLTPSNFETDKLSSQAFLMNKENKDLSQCKRIQRKRTKSKRTIIKKNTIFLSRKSSKNKTHIPTFFLQNQNQNNSVSQKTQMHNTPGQSSDQGGGDHNYGGLCKSDQNDSQTNRQTLFGNQQNIHQSFDQKRNDFTTADSIDKYQHKKVNFKLKNYQSLGNNRGHILKKINRSKDPDFPCFDRKNICSKTVIIKPYQNSSFANKSPNLKKSAQVYRTFNDTSNFLDGNSSDERSFSPGTVYQGERKISKISKKSIISQNFTFKKRNKRQQILNKLNSFIQEVSNEQKMSKQQNQYYDSAITELQDLSKTTFRNYEPEALAGTEEICSLKKFINSINPSLRKRHSKKQIGKRNIE